MTASSYDLVVIGGGSGGVRASRLAASLGKRVLVVEKSAMGGTCVHRGCIPKKLLAGAARFHAAAHHSEGLGTRVTPQLDFPSLQRGVAAELSRLDGVYARVVGGVGVEIIHGEARIAGDRTVRIRLPNGTEHEVRGEHVLLANGSRPRRLDLPGCEHLWTSDDALSTAQRPASLVVLGAGYVAIELASIFRDFGCDVTLLCRGPRLLRAFDVGVGDVVLRAFDARGIRVAIEDDATRIDATGPHLAVTTRRGSTYLAERVVAAVGRTSNLDEVGLEAVGLEPSHFRPTDDHPLACHGSPLTWLHAVGDAVGGDLTPVALAQGMHYVERVFSAPARRRSRIVPTAVFGTPEVAAAGMTEREAAVAGRPLAIFETEFVPLLHRLTGRSERTWMKVVVDRTTDRVLGVHVVGEHAAEIVQGFAVALECGATKEQLDATLGIHPTAAEELVTMRSPTRLVG